jgi:hypothetical protein
MQPPALFSLLPTLITHGAEPIRPHVLIACPGIVPLSYTVVTQWSDWLPFDGRNSILGKFCVRNRVHNDSIRSSTIYSDTSANE